MKDFGLEKISRILIALIIDERILILTDINFNVARVIHPFWLIHPVKGDWTFDRHWSAYKNSKLNDIICLKICF